MKRYACLLILLTGCGYNGSQLDDLKEFINETKMQKPPPPPPLVPKPVSVEQVTFDLGERDPFMPGILSSSPKEDQEKSNSIRPNLNRPREPLEDFDLDALIFVGTIKKQGNLVGLIKDPKNRIHVVRVGNYMGRNFGKIISIEEQEIKVKEIIPDAPGRWKERIITIKMGEKS